MRSSELGVRGSIDDRDEAAAGSIAADSGLDILIVEDNLYEIELIMHALKEHQLSNRIKAVRDGAEALDFIFCKGDYTNRDSRQHPKLILLDLKLPKVDGLEVLRRVRADPNTQDIPVVILTQSQEDNNVIEGYKLGANSFLVKRLDFEEFMKGVLALGTYWMVMNRAPIKRAG